MFIEYSVRLNASKQHGATMQLMDDLSLAASFIGISPSGQHAMVAKLQAEWVVLKPAVEAAAQLVETRQHRFIVLDRRGDDTYPLHRHVDGVPRPHVEFRI